MAENLQTINRRIQSIKNTQQITRAMKMVAAAKLRKAEERATNAALYGEKIRIILRNLLSAMEEYSHPLFESREVKTSRVLLISGDKGLCGSFNHSVIRAARKFIDKTAKKGINVELDLIGKKGHDFFKSRNVSVGLNETDKYGREITPCALDISKKYVEQFLDGDMDELHVFFNKFITVVTHETVHRKLLPLEEVDGGTKSGIEHLFEPSKEEVLERLMPKYFFTQIHNAMLNSEAAEHGARMTAMDSATNNAKDMIDHLTLTRNRIRQTTITRELIEIVSSAEALRG